MVKHITLHSRTPEIQRLHSLETGVANIKANHNVTTMGQPTENTPNMYSLVDTTEKVVEEQGVDESLPTSQRILNSRPASIYQQDANTLLRESV